VFGVYSNDIVTTFMISGLSASTRIHFHHPVSSARTIFLITPVLGLHCPVLAYEPIYAVDLCRRCQPTTIAEGNTSLSFIQVAGILTITEHPLQEKLYCGGPVPAKKNLKSRTI
jgi:hypothetical protein